MASQTQDRVSLLENSHFRLADKFDSRYASSQEFEDFMMNKSEEDWIEITGIPPRFCFNLFDVSSSPITQFDLYSVLCSPS